MSEPFLGEIKMFGFNFAPRGWAFCNGQSLPISQNQALYSLLGGTYGSDSRTYFNLPDLRGRVPMHFGQGTGLTDRAIGAQSGTESATLTTDQIPAHSHPQNVTTAFGNAKSPVGAVPATANDGECNYRNEEPNATLQATSAGGGQAHDNMPPFTAVNFSIALQGIFPPRS